MVTQVEIARRIGLDVSSVNKILNKRQGPVFRKETVKKVFKLARQLGYDFGRLKYQHRRRHTRKPVSMWPLSLRSSTGFCMGRSDTENGSTGKLEVGSVTSLMRAPHTEMSRIVATPWS